jgi:hypothetical protein
MPHFAWRLLACLPITAHATMVAPGEHNVASSSDTTPTHYSNGDQVSCPANLSCRAVVWGKINSGGLNDALPTKMTSSNTPIVKVVSTYGAMAILHEDGSVTAIGEASSGAEGVPAKASTPTSKVISIAAVRGQTMGAFAAVHEDGSVSAWGDSSLVGSLPASVTSPTSPVVSIASNMKGFAALHADGSVSGFGDQNYYLNNIDLPGSVTSPASPVISLHNTDYDFAAIHADGTVSNWGYSASVAPASASVATPASPCVAIATSYTKFVALFADGTALPFDDSDTLPTEVTSPSSPVIRIETNQGAFAFLHQDGSVTVWGQSVTGGTGAPASVTSPSSPVVSLSSTCCAFAALHANGAVSVWCDTSYYVGAHTPPASVTSPASPVVKVIGNSCAFAAIHQDGSVSTWGGTGTSPFGGDDRNCGGVAPASVGAARTSNVIGVASTPASMVTDHGAFAALHESGAVSVWGEGGWGGTTSPGGLGFTGAPSAVTDPSPGELVVGIASSAYVFLALIMNSPCPAGQSLASTGRASTLTEAVDPSLPSVSCEPCSPGTMQPLARQDTCDNCTAGTYQSLEGQSSCTACPIGTYATLEGLAICTPCPPGRRQPLLGQTLEMSCLYCNAGEHQPLEGSSECLACPPGHFSGPGASECTPCFLGTYAVNGATCDSCPPGSTTLSTGAASVNDCSCAEDYYDADAGPEVECLTCPVGVACVGGATLAELPVMAGYYRHAAL